MQNRRSFLQKCFVALASTGLFSFLAPDLQAKTPKKEGVFSHQVFFWLKEPDNAEVRQAFEKGMKTFFQKCDCMRSHFTGVPAHTPRDVVDNSYTYSIVVTFDSREAHDQYQAHPAHQEFLEKYASYWTKVQVYDAIAI